MLARHPNKFPNGLNTKNSVYSAPSATVVRRPLSGGRDRSPEGSLMLQRIGWIRPSPDERRWWFIQGAVILASVLAIGTVVFLALR